jgi:hypothetical protein
MRSVAAMPFASLVVVAVVRLTAGGARYCLMR